MRCPFCATDEDKVIDSRQSKDGREIRRRRECLACARRFTTYERVEEALPMVIKADDRREPFDRNKIERGLKRAVAKRPVSVEALEELAEEIEREICRPGPQRGLGARRSASGSCPGCRQLDEVSYVRFASIYRDFRDIDEFAKELGEVVKARK